MKKILALILALSMVVALCACGESTPSSASDLQEANSSTNTSSTSSSSQNKKTSNQYLLGTPVQKECEKGIVSVSLDSVSIENNCITIQMTNHGDVGMGNQSYMWTVIYYDSDGYALNKGYITPNNQTEPFKPNKTISLSEDFSYRLNSNPDISYISIEYLGFQSKNDNYWDIHLMYHYAVDLDGKEVDYSMLTQ